MSVRKFVDNNGLAYLIQKIQLWLGNKVDKATGYSMVADTEIARLANVSNYDDTALQTAVSGKTTLSAVQALGYQTASDVSTAIQTALAGISGVSFSIVSELPVSGQAGVFYLVPNSGSGNNTYDEYVWITITENETTTTRFEKIGTTAVDLSGYLQAADMVAVTNAEIDAIISPPSQGE